MSHIKYMSTLYLLTLQVFAEGFKRQYVMFYELMYCLFGLLKAYQWNMSRKVFVCSACGRLYRWNMSRKVFVCSACGRLY